MRIIITILVLAGLVSCTIDEARSAYGFNAERSFDKSGPPVTFSDNLHEGSRWQDRELARLLRQRFCQADINACAGIEQITMSRQGDSIYLSVNQDNNANRYRLVTGGCLWSASCEFEFELQAL